MKTAPVLLEGNTKDPQKALILLHGRGSDGQDILSLAGHLKVEDFLLIAPTAPGNTWYPLSFLAPTRKNEPALSRSLETVQEMIEKAEERGIEKEQIYLLGFSQGACLALEFAARNPSKYGGIVAFTGGLIGDQVDMNRYKGDFKGTPLFIGSGDPDPHVPPSRVQMSAMVLERLGAKVTEKIYSHIGHTVIPDEIKQANKLIFE